MSVMKNIMETVELQKQKSPKTTELQCPIVDLHMPVRLSKVRLG
jgi:hypothetical protein